MKKLNMRGFGAVEALLIVVILGIIGGAGYYVFNSQKKTNATLENTAKTQGEPQNEKTDTTAEKPPASDFSLTTKLTSLNKKFILSVPDGWTFINDTELDYAYATSMSYKKGEAAKVDNVLGHRGGGFTKTSFVIQYSKDQLKDYYSASKTDGTLKLNSGKEAKKYLYVSDGSTDIPTGSKSYGYQIDYEGGTIVLTYVVNPTDADQKNLVEASIKTLNF